MIKQYIFSILLINTTFPQDVNIDSLKNINEFGIAENMSLSILNHWQKISYKHDFLNCQFYPSCSNYFALAIAKNGLTIGSIHGVDRIIRCNPGAVGHHFKQKPPLFYSDGRLVDMINFKKDDNITNLEIFPVFLSTIPGLGRAYYGREFDGIVSFIYTVGSLLFSYHSFNSGNDLLGWMTGAVSLLFWSTDIYSTVKLANERPEN